MLETSRPTTVKNMGIKIPQIEHPISKMAKENGMEVALSPFPIATEESRPVAFEDESIYKSKKNKSSKPLKCKATSDNVNLDGTFLTNIPDSVSVIEGDVSATRLPLFGNRSTMQSRASIQSRRGSEKNSEKPNLSEISDIFQKKLSSNYYEVRKKFIDNDPDRNGNVPKEALMRILQQLTGFQVTNNSLNCLLESWKIKLDKQVFSFTEIHSMFLNKQRDKTEPDFIDPVSRQMYKIIEPPKMNAVDVYEVLKEKFRSRSMYLTDLFPNSVESQRFSINKNDFKNSLYKIMIDLVPSEMDKLWLKFDPTKQGSIDSMKFLKQLGILSNPTASLTPRIRGICTNMKEVGSLNSLEEILKSKLREGYTTLGQDFQLKDINQTGFISPADFLQVLSEHNLNLEENQLGEFLSRCVVTPTKNGIPYREFLIRFQDRSEAGVTHKLLTNREKKKSSDGENQMNPLSLVEMKLINIFQKDFLRLLENFRKLDKYGNGSIEIKDFQTVLENQMNMKFTEDQFNKVLDNLPLNRNQSVPYLDYLKQFDTGNFSPLSFNTKSDNIPESVKPESLSEIISGEKHLGKSTVEIKNIIRQVFDSSYSEIENAFIELDESNSKVMTQEMMYQLIKKLNIKPELTRGDIRTVWSTFILNERQLLDFKEFTRYFLYNKSTASFPNAKVCPPVKGDSDLMPKSKTLNGDTDMVLDSLRSKINIMYNDLTKEFSSMDPENTGEISLGQFKEIVKELSLHLTDHEIQMMSEKFTTSNNRISYVNMLKPFGDHKRNPECNSLEKQVVSNEKKAGIDILFQKLRLLNQPSVRRSIKKVDSSNSGLIPVTELRALLLVEGVSLTEEEVFHLMNSYDKNLKGFINYKTLLHEIQLNN